MPLGIAILTVFGEWTSFVTRANIQVVAVIRGMSCANILAMAMMHLVFRSSSGAYEKLRVTIALSRWLLHRDAIHPSYRMLDMLM